MILKRMDQKRRRYKEILVDKEKTYALLFGKLEKIAAFVFQGFYIDSVLLEENEKQK